MSPVPEHVKRIKRVAEAVLFRARDRCECDGGCGAGHPGRRCDRERDERGFWAYNLAGHLSATWMPETGLESPGGVWTVVLTLDPVDGDRSNWSEKNLRATCQSCSLARSGAAFGRGGPRGGVEKFFD